MPAIHGKTTRILLDGFDISQFFREANRANNADEVDVTHFGTGEYKEYIAGFIGATVDLQGMFENSTDVDPLTGTTKTLDELLDGLLAVDTTNRLLSIGSEGFGVGKRITLFEGTELSYEIMNSVTDVVTATANFSSKAPSRNGYSLHSPDTAETGAADGATVDANTGQVAVPAGGSNDGATGHLHVTDNTRAGATVVKIQHSHDGTTWVDLITFDSVPAGTRSYQRLEVTGDVRRRFRASWTGTGDIKFLVGIARL